MIDKEKLEEFSKRQADLMNEYFQAAVKESKNTDALNYRDGSRPDIDKMRELRDKAYQLAHDAQQEIDMEIQNSNGWNEFAGKYICFDDMDDECYMHIYDDVEKGVQRLYSGCKFVGNAYFVGEGFVRMYSDYDISVNKKKDIRIITKDEFDYTINEAIKKFNF